MARTASASDHFRLFCKDVFHSLTSNIANYNHKNQESDLFLYELTVDAKHTRSHFSPAMEKAVHTFAYLFRNVCRSECRRRSRTMQGGKSFEEFIMKLTVLEDNYYLRLLAWIAFLYELTMSCYLKLKCDRVENSRRCLQQSMNIEHFKNEENWNKFLETANRIAFFYDPLVKSLGDPLPESDILAPFQYVLKETIRLNRYKLNMIKLRMLRESANPKPYSKLKCLWKFNPQQIRFGHTVFRKKKNAEKPSSKNIRTVSESVLSASEVQRDSDSQVDDILCGPSTSSAARNSNVSGSGASGDKENLIVGGYENLVFVISETYRSSLKKDGQGYGSRKYFKIYSPAKERLDKVENLNSILEDNIRRGKTKKISEELEVVCLQEGNEINSGHQIIVVDSSSEVEDDDEFDACQKSFIDRLLRRWQEFSLDDVEMMHHALKSRFWDPRLHQECPKYIGSYWSSSRQEVIMLVNHTQHRFSTE